MISAGLPGDTLFGEIVISANNLSLLGGGWSIRLHQGNAGYADVIATITADDVIRTKTRVKYQGAWMPWQNLSDDNSISQATKGFGLGNTVGYVLLDANTAVYGGFYYWGPTALNVPFLYGAMIVIPRSASSSNKPSLTQIASQETSGVLETHAILAIRKASDNGDGSWGEWEYINPPMESGVEYRTTERFWGRPVYYKIVDCGQIADNKQVEHGVTNMRDCIFCQGLRGAMPMPSISNNDLSDQWSYYVADVNRTKITLACGTAAAGGNCHVILKYTKTTD